jgi:hypothetical protein
MIYRFVYVEKSFNGHTWLSHNDLPLEMYKNITESFFKHGGIDIKETVDNNIRTIYSDWSTETGYDQWINDHKVSSYITLRDTYNKENLIDSSLFGPEKINE